MIQNEDYSYCNIAQGTDKGCKRAANEDNLRSFDCINGRVATVCDGMGGHVGGATASRIAVETIEAYLSSQYFEDPREAIACAIDQANNAILNEAAANPELTGMGSTCVMLIVRGGKVYIGHVGDSRIYLIRERRIVQLTKDHSFVQMLVDMGQISHAEAEHHPRKNEITNALGIPNMQPATVRETALIPQAGDCFLLCSDGLSGMVDDDKICKIVSQQTTVSQQDRVNILINQAKENGGLDNITVQLVEFSVTPGNISAPKWYTKPINYVYALIACIVIGGGLYGGPKLFKLVKEKMEQKTDDSNNNGTDSSIITDTNPEREVEILPDCVLSSRPSTLFLVIDEGLKIDVIEGRDRKTKFTSPKTTGIARDSVEIVQDLNYASKWDQNGDYMVNLLDGYGEDMISFRIKTVEKIYVINCTWAKSTTNNGNANLKKGNNPNKGNNTVVPQQPTTGDNNDGSSLFKNLKNGEENSGDEGKNGDENAGSTDDPNKGKSKSTENPDKNTTGNSGMNTPV